MFSVRLTAFFTSLVMLAATHAIADDNLSVSEDNNLQLMQAAIDGSHRDKRNVARDVYRHPLKTLSFFGIQPDMTVVEILPGGKGWYMEILAPYLRDKGTYYAASFDQDSVIEYFQRGIAMFNKKVAAHPEVYKNIKVTEFAPPSKTDIAPAGSADMVLTFRNVHNWMKRGGDRAAFESFYKTLKSGGILGVVEHRANTDQPQDPKAESGYVREDFVIELAESVGFKLAAKSEINANPRDTKDYKAGVWTLPPSLRLKDDNNEKYLAIGESDRMTLKFIKP